MTEPIYALSVQQPWAWLIVNRHKDVENRTWSTAFRGPVWIHAGKTIDRSPSTIYFLECFKKAAGPPLQLPETFETGGIVGKAIITDCLSEIDSIWFTGPYGLVMRNASPVPFRPCRGMLKFFKPALEVAG